MAGNIAITGSLIGPMAGGAAAATATITVTTTGAQTLSIDTLNVSAGETVTVTWGDGNSTDYTGNNAAITHDYAGAGTWTVTLSNPAAVTALEIDDGKVTLNSADIADMVNIVTFRANNLKAGTFDSVDVSAWRPTTFRLYSMPAGYAGTFDSVDVGAWRPTTFQVASMPAGYAGTFDSVDVGAWRPSVIYIFSMPAGYAGTFDSADVSAWRPTILYLYSMPAGYAGTFDSADVSAWQPQSFRLFNMPTATFTITITATGFATWTTVSSFIMSGNGLLQAAVDQILADLYAAFPTRTVPNGAIDLGGTNAAPTGVSPGAAECPPTTGYNTAYELVNDSCGVSANHWATVVVS